MWILTNQQGVVA